MLNFDEISKIVKPHIDDMVFCVNSGFYGYFEKYKEMSHEHDSIVRSHLIFIEIRSFVNNRFNGKLGVEIKSRTNESYFLLLENKVVVRFKKHDEKGLTSNAPTKYVKAYACQKVLEGIPETIHLNCGYVADPSFRKIESILLSYPKTQSSNYWSKHLTTDAYIQSINNIDVTSDKNEKVFVGSYHPTIKVKRGVQNATNI